MVFVGILLLCGLASAVEPGFQATLGRAGMQETVDKVLPPLIAKTVGMHLPDIHGSQSSFSYSLSGIVITTLTYGTATVSLANHLGFTISGVHLHLKLDWSYKEKVWPHLPRGSGSADVDASNVALGVQMVASLGPDNKIAVKTSSVTCDIGSVKVTTHGSLLSWLYNIIIDLFKGTLKSAAENAIKNELGTLINTQAASLVAAIPYIAPIDTLASLNYYLTSAPTFPAPVGQYLQVDFVGAVFPKNGAVPNLPHHGITQYHSGKMLDFVLDQYFFDSALDTYQRLGQFNWMITQANMPANSPVRMNTSDFAIVFPLLNQRYPAREMRVHLRTSTTPALTLTPTAQSASIPALATVLVDANGRGNFTEAFTLAITQSGSLLVSMRNSRLYVQLETLKFALTVVNSTVGQFDENIFNVLINTVINLVVLPAANQALAAGLPLPTIPNLQLVNPILQFDNGVVEIGTDFHFVLTEETTLARNQVAPTEAPVIDVGTYEFGRNYLADSTATL